MKPADAGRDYTELVRSGYDRIAATYNRTRALEAEPALAWLIDLLPDGASALDLGCGAGVPITRALAAHCKVIGVDISAAQLALARKQVPSADFVQGDVARIDFPPATFDAVVSFYAIFHIARDQHAPLFAKIFDWLKPGGSFLATLAMSNEAGYTEDLLGTEMYWSNYGVAEYRAMLDDAGFALVREAAIASGFADSSLPPEIHPLMLARKPAPGLARDGDDEG